MEYDFCPSATTQQPATFGPHSPIQLLRHSIPIETANLQAWPFLVKNCTSGCGSCCQCCLKGLSSLVPAHTRGDKDFATFAILQFRPSFIIMWPYFQCCQISLSTQPIHPILIKWQIFVLSWQCGKWLKSYDWPYPYMQKAGDNWDISPQFFLDFPQNFRLRTRNQYCTQAIAWGSTI